MGKLQLPEKAGRTKERERLGRILTFYSIDIAMFVYIKNIFLLFYGRN